MQGSTAGRAVPRRARIMVRAGGFTMPGPDDPRVRRADGGLVLDLADAWAEAAHQGRRHVLLVTAPRAGGSTALRELAGSSPTVVDCRSAGPSPTVVDCRSAGPAAWRAALDGSAGTVLIDHAEALQSDHLAELLGAVAAVTRDDLRVAVALRRAALSPDLADPVLLELHLDPLAPAEASALSGGAASALTAWSRMGRGDPAALALVRRPPLLVAALAGLRAGRSPSDLVEDARTVLEEERLTVDAPGATAVAGRMVDVPGGSVVVGSPPTEEGRWDDEGPRVEVVVRPFSIGSHPVTVGDYAEFLAAVDDIEPPLAWDDPRFNGAAQPVVGVSRGAAERYAAWRGRRLPTESEWELACRAGSAEPRYGDLDMVAWHGGNSGGTTHPVGRRRPNGLGLHDMLGNAWEWAADDFHPSREATPRDGTAFTSGERGADGVLRGGTWADSPRTVRAATRLGGHPGPRVANIGLRLASSS